MPVSRDRICLLSGASGEDVFRGSRCQHFNRSCAELADNSPFDLLLTTTLSDINLDRIIKKQTFPCVL